MTGVYRSRIPVVDEDNPIAYGRDDIRGLPIMHDDMVQVMEYLGTTIEWTGFMTHKDYVDVPNPQRVPPFLPPDPVPVMNIRILARPTIPPVPTGVTVSDITTTTALVSWDDLLTNNSGEIVTGYIIGLKNGVIFQEIPSQPIQPPPNLITDTSYTLTNLAPGTLYEVSVASYYPDTTSSFSYPITFTTSSVS